MERSSTAGTIMTLLPTSDDEDDFVKADAFDAAMNLFDATLVDDFNLHEDLDKAFEIIWEAAAASPTEATRDEDAVRALMKVLHASSLEYTPDYTAGPMQPIWRIMADAILESFAVVSRKSEAKDN